MSDKKDLFWADQLADRIISRDSFRYSDKKIPKFDEYTVKTSASISGVLHIGRLSDTIRGASVYRALKDTGKKAKLVWVAEDMDPLRKIPKGLPASYDKYLGVPVSKIPDPEECHSSYAEHHTSLYFEVLHQFTFEEMEKFSMQEEYKKGNFREHIKKILQDVKTVIEIQNKHRTNPLKKGWKPWTPICSNCGKIITPKVRLNEDSKVSYVCQDYNFETTVAKGCGHRGEADPLKDEGKLVWKSEWAAQWARWNIVTEGAGKEYQVPNSAFWINSEIAERVLDYPAPEPIFYEHIMVDGVKMSASLGNVIYPRDWLKVAKPQVLRYYYNKRLMMTRSFSWKELPNLYDEYDTAAGIYRGEYEDGNEREDAQLKRQFEIANDPKQKDAYLLMSYSHAAMLAQTFTDEKAIVASLKKSGHYNKDTEQELLQRVEKARIWIEKYAPEDVKFTIQKKVNAATKKKIDTPIIDAIKKFNELIKSKEWTEEDLFGTVYEQLKKDKVKPKEFFKGCYLILLNKEQGPRLVPFVLNLGERATNLFDQL